MSIFTKTFTPKATPANIELARATALYYAKKEGEKAAKRATKKRTSIEAEVNNINMTFVDAAAKQQQSTGMTDEEIKKAQENIGAPTKQKEASKPVKEKAKTYKPMTDEEIKKAQEELNSYVTPKKSEEKASQQQKTQQPTKKVEKQETKTEAVEAAKDVTILDKDGKTVIAEMETPKAKPHIAVEAARDVTGASIMANFMNAPKPDEKVTPQQMNGSAFVQTVQNKPVMLPPQNDGVLPIDNVREFLNMNPQIAPPVSPVPGGAHKKAKELKKHVSFINGLHKQVDDIELTCLLNLVKGPWLRERMRQENAVGVNNPRLKEVPVETYDATGRFNYAFEIELAGKGQKKILVILMQSVPAYRNGMWTNDQTAFVTKRKEQVQAQPQEEPIAVNSNGNQ